MRVHPDSTDIDRAAPKLEGESAACPARSAGSARRLVPTQRGLDVFAIEVGSWQADGRVPGGVTDQKSAVDDRRPGAADSTR
jgi:hypothetical protein